MESDKVTQIKLPGPGDDASPFMIPCSVRKGNSTTFRSLREFDDPIRLDDDTFKLFVWRSTNLREIATILFIRDRHFFSNIQHQHSSTSRTLFAFRIVRFDMNKGYFVERKVNYDVSILSKSQITSIKEDVRKTLFGSQIEQQEQETKSAQNGISSSRLFNTIFDDCLTSTLPKKVDDEKAKITLNSMGWQDGDILDCIVYSDDDEVIPNREENGHRRRYGVGRSSPHNQYEERRYDRDRWSDSGRNDKQSFRSRRSASPIQRGDH